MAKEPVVWVIAYISSKYLNRLNSDLRSSPKYKPIKVFIPMVRVLKKKHKGQEYFDEVPLLFNYGFFRVPKYFISNPHFMEKMKGDIHCIYNWVKDKARQSEPEKYKVNKSIGLHNPNSYSLVGQSELILLKKMQHYKSIFSKTEVNNLYPGKVIILKGYPFDDLEAEIIDIDSKRKKVKVRLLIAENMNIVTVSFENIFFTMYKSNYMNTEMREDSLDDFKNRSGNISNLMRDE